MCKLKVKTISLDSFLALNTDLTADAIKQGGPLKIVARLGSSLFLKTHNFSYDKKKISKKFLKEPCLILMNHVYETDFKIAFKILGKSKFSIAAARDAFIGRKSTLQQLGATAVLRYSYDPVFVKQAYKCINRLHQSLLIYPEAEYSADGLSMGVAPTFGKLVKLLNVPVLFLRSYGTYAMQPMFNAVMNKNKITATLDEILTKEEVKNLSDKEIYEKISKLFNDINYYEEDKKLGNKITSKDRAKHLHRILYKCPICGEEYSMYGEGITITCKKCGAKFTLNEDGSLISEDHKLSFPSVPSWTNFEREEVKKEIIANKYKVSFKAKVYAFKNYDALYNLGTDADVVVDKFGVKLKYLNKELFYDTKDINALCATMNCLSLGPTLIIDIDDINYLLCPYEDDGKLFKIRIASKIAYSLNHKV